MMTIITIMMDKISKTTSKANPNQRQQGRRHIACFYKTFSMTVFINP